MSTAVKISLSLVAAVVLVVVALLGVGAYYIYNAVSEGGISQKTYDSIKVGQPQAEVLRQLPEEQSELAAADLKENPPPPAKATCRYHVDEDLSKSDGKTVPVFRFCFAGGKLVTKNKL